MRKNYRSWAERREIVRSLIAEDSPPSLDSFGLSKNEEQYFRSRSNKAIDKLARETSAFKAYYTLPVARPFRYVMVASILVALAAASAALYLFVNEPSLDKVTPIFAGLGTISVIAIGWAVVGSMTHRYNIRQKTLDLLFARFSHQTFTDALTRFHDAFGSEPDSNLVTWQKLADLRASPDETDRRVATAATYLLNYFEFIASGVACGDLDGAIIKDNVRGLIVFYHDKCAPFINESYRRNGKTFENLIRLRTHYREP